MDAHLEWVINRDKRVTLRNRRVGKLLSRYEDSRPTDRKCNIGLLTHNLFIKRLFTVRLNWLLAEQLRGKINMSRAKTVEEVRGELIEHIKAIAGYWASLPDKTDQERCDGVAFSILTMIDGCSGGMPAFDLLVSPHEDDKQYHIENGEDYYEPNMMVNDCYLHDMYYS